MARYVMLFVWAACCCCSFADVVSEQPTSADKPNPNTIGVGDTFRGTWDTEGQHDTVNLQTDEATVCTFELHFDAEVRGQLRIDGIFSGSRRPPVDGQPLRYCGYRIPAGTTKLEIQGGSRERKIAYRLLVTKVEDLDELDCEPNDKDQQALTLEPGIPVVGLNSVPETDRDWYAYHNRRPGPHYLHVVRRSTGGPRHREGILRIRRGRDRLYSYRLNDLTDDFHFYPVLDQGEHHLEIVTGGHNFAGYRLMLRPWKPSDEGDVDHQAARALQRALTWLDSQTPADTKVRSSYETVAESLTMAALSEAGRFAQHGDRIEKQYVNWLAKRYEKIDEAQWRENPMRTPSAKLYQAAITTLALAEVARAGSQSAGKLARDSLRYLLATQQTQGRPKVWKGPFGPAARTYGGWRYNRDSHDADLSVTGWCWIAIVACDAAGIEEPGMAQALDAGIRFATQCKGVPKGFRYTHSTGNTTHTLQGVGALMFLLHGRQGRQLIDALSVLDAHLPAGTQVDDRGAYAFYYWYYGTRVNYLRGGEAWDRWRTAMMLQLIRRQHRDGHWEAFDGETSPGHRYATALGAMILRICLEDVPAYLRQEVKGF